MPTAAVPNTTDAQRHVLQVQEPGPLGSIYSPSSSSKSPPPSSSSSFSPLPPSKMGGLPVVQCPCGSGACVIRTSHTSKNPKRKFFACPKRSCKFFNGWCDEVIAPVCPCRVGTCSVNTDPVSQKKFFACRIKKGHGACGFFQWVDKYDASAKVRSAKAEIAGSPRNVPPRGVVAGPTALKEDPNFTFADFLEASQSDGSVDLISKFEELVNRLSPEKKQSNFDDMTVDNQPSIPSTGSEDSEMEESEPPSDLDETLPVSHRPSSFTDVHLRQTEFLKQLSAAARDTVTGGESSLNMLLERYNEEKRQFEEHSCIETKTLNAYAGCNGQIEFLRQEVLRLKGMLLHVEKELSDREEEFIGLNTNLGRHKVELAKASMGNAFTNAAEASRILRSMELERSAMKARGQETA